MKKLLLIAIACFTSISLNAQSYKFDFGAEKPAKGYIKITPSDIFSEATGYGFDRVNVKPQSVVRTGKGVQCDFITSLNPFFFSVNVPDGNYRVKVTLGDTKGESITTIKAESRRLMEQNITTKNGETKVCEFNVNVRNPIISDNDKVRIKEREKNKLNWDNKLTIEFNDKLPCVAALEIERVEDVVTLFLCGNSTVVDQDYEPWCGWGQMLPLFFDTNVSVANYAESGEAANSFVSAGRLRKIISMAKKGDYIFVEFGHNDQKQKGEGVGAFTTYKENMRKFIIEARKKECIPVLVTSMHRRRFDENGKVQNSLGDFPEAVRQLAKEEGTILIDLNNMSAVLYEAMGVEGSLKAFVHYPANTFKGQDTALADNTHFNCYGGYQIAKCIVEGVKANNLDIAKYIRKDYVPFDPAKPDNADTFYLPLSPFVEVQKPDGN